MSEIRFGTDGWRAVIAEDYTFDNVRAVTQATAEYLRRHDLSDREVVIGYDTRFLSGSFARAAAEVMAGNGIRVALSETPLPTPALSFAVVQRGSGSGIVITASHNPARWNGFKVKPEYGGAAAPAVTDEIERAVPAVIAEGRVQRFAAGEAEAAKLIQSFDGRPAYLAAARAFVGIEGIRNAGLSVHVDSMYGAAASWTADAIGQGGSTRVTEIHGQRNPAFPGLRAPEPIAPNLGEQMEMLAAGGYDVGLSTDGDGDRFGLVDEHGRFITQHQAFALLTRYFLAERGDRGPIVRSITMSRMVDRLGEIYDCPVHETQVGFRFLGPRMMETDALIAGEESGGYAFRGHIPERDGVLSGLLLLDYMVRTGKKPSELLADLYAEVGPHAYDRVDITVRTEEKDAIRERVAEADPGEIAGFAVESRDTLDGYRFRLEGGWWLLMRFSGTEPLLRIYAEMPSQEQVQAALQAGQELAGVTL
jgi:phosphomannomutase